MAEASRASAMESPVIFQYIDMAPALIAVLRLYWSLSAAVAVLRTLPTTQVGQGGSPRAGTGGRSGGACACTPSPAHGGGERRDQQAATGPQHVRSFDRARTPGSQ